MTRTAGFTALIYIVLLVGGCRTDSPKTPAAGTPADGTAGNLGDQPEEAVTAPGTAAPGMAVPPTEEVQETETPATDLAEGVGSPGLGSPGLGDPFYPNLGNGGYDVQHYTIDLTVDVEQNFVNGTTTVEALTTQELARFNLDLVGLQVRGVTLDGQEAEFARDGQELTIFAPHTLAENQAFEVAVTYQGTPELIDDPGVPFLDLGWQRQNNGLFAVGEPSGSMNWFPSNNHPSDKATFTFRVTVPDGYQAVANGVLLETTEADNGPTFVWEMAQPMATYLATVQVNAYDMDESIGPGGVRIRNYFPVDTQQIVRYQFEITPEMLAFMSDLIAPYPFSEYGVVLLDQSTGWALETQTLSTFGATGASEGVIFHELMHQWFGNSVSPATWQDIWMNEGFANYFSAIWMGYRSSSASDEFRRSPAAVEEIMRQLYGQLERQNVGPTVVRQVGQMFGPASYDRGAWTLHALRLTVGDALFFEILREFYASYQHGTASTADFIDTAVEVAGREAEGVLNAWLYDEALPPVP